MTHVRTQIRESLREVLALSLPDFDVYSSRKYAKNIGDRPMIDMRFLNENIDNETMGTERRRVSSLYVRVQRAAVETEIDDLLDEDEICVNDVVMSDWWEGLLTEPPEQMQVNWSDSDQGGMIIGSIVLRYDIEYRVTQTNIETTR